MNKLLSSTVASISALLIGYVAAVILVQSLSWQYFYYTSQGLHLSQLLSRWSVPFFIISILLFAACVVFLVAAIRSKKSHSNEKKPRFWRLADYSLLAVLTFCVCLLCVILAYKNGRYYGTAALLLLSAFAYLTVMLFMMETVARIRDRQIKQTLYWPRFFRQFPIRRPIGLLMALVLAGLLVYLLLIFPLAAHWSTYSTQMFVFAAFLLVVLTYFCTFVLSLSKEYEQINAEKIQAERLKTELITNVSHDIRTPLTSIINYVDLLKTLPIEDDEFIEYVGVLDRKSDRLKCLIDDLMEASKAGTGNVSVDLEELDLVEIVGQVAGDFDERFVERHLVLVFPQPDQPIRARADSRHLSRVLENLFKNITKYALEGTRVFVEIAARNNCPTIILRNTSQDPIFLPSDALTEQFIRGDRSRQTEGNGLGLYIAKSLMESMGGGLSIRTIGDLFEAALWFN